MTKHKRLTVSDYNAHDPINDYSKYLTRGLAKIIRDMDLKLFIRGSDVVEYVNTVTQLAYTHEGFAQAYRELCINFRFRKDLQWLNELEPEFDNYQYLTMSIVQEIEFAFLYCRRNKGRNVKTFGTFIKEFIGNYKPNYDIIEEYALWLAKGKGSKYHLKPSSQFPLSPFKEKDFGEKMIDFLEKLLNQIYNDHIIRSRWLRMDTGERKPWDTFKETTPKKEGVGDEDFRGLVAENRIYISQILNITTAQERKGYIFNLKSALLTGYTLLKSLYGNNSSLVEKGIDGVLAIRNIYRNSSGPWSAVKKVGKKYIITFLKNNPVLIMVKTLL
jgi:hypothetical protein